LSTNRPLALAVEAAATPGSYGTAPDGFRLPERTRLGEVTLRVSNLERSLDFYAKLLGFRVLEQSATRAVLGAVGEARALIVLQEVPGVAPVPDRGRLGLFHVAIVVPTRGDLGRLVQQLAARGVALGAGDHLVSEAFYLQDPDGLGLELYRDRPRTEWRRVNRELREWLRREREATGRGCPLVRRLAMCICASEHLSRRPHSSRMRWALT
jgi:catechol 2,3-dioxygenase